MLDIKWIRDNPEALDEALKKRSAEPMAATLLALDDKRRSVIQKLQDMQSRRNAASKEIGAAMAQKNTELAEKLKAEVATIKSDEGTATWAIASARSSPQRKRSGKGKPGR